MGKRKTGVVTLRAGGKAGRNSVPGIWEIGLGGGGYGARDILGDGRGKERVEEREEEGERGGEGWGGGDGEWGVGGGGWGLRTERGGGEG